MKEDENRKATKASTISFRIETRLKDRLRGIARNRGHSLSSLIEMFLRNASDFPVDPSFKLSIPEDKRQYHRKEIILPARWRITQKENMVEHDVILKDISVGGAYTEYIDGQSLDIVKDLQVSPLALVVRLPGEKQQIVIHCQPRRFHLAQEILGVGLEFTEILDEKSKAVLNKYLT
jgi:antitoxin component of RelBE/YafQ-DinJ toxin-antitoxin module